MNTGIRRRIRKFAGLFEVPYLFVLNDMLQVRNEICSLVLGLTGGACFLLSTEASGAPGSGLRNRIQQFAPRDTRSMFQTGRGIRHDFAFHQHGFSFHGERRVFVRQVAVPVYLYPFYCPDYEDLSYLGNGSDYDYRDSSVASPQPEYSNAAGSSAPVIIVISQGNSPSTGASSAEHANGNNASSATDVRQTVEAERSGGWNKTGTELSTSGSVAATQPAQPAAKTESAAAQARAGVFGYLVLVSWLKDDGKDVIFVQNTETKQVQRITSKANKDNLRLVEVHPNKDLSDFEAIVSNGSEQGSVGFPSE
jgi:hypothetical protein